MDKPIGFGRKKRLGDLLVEAGTITQDQLTQALNVQKTEKKGQRLGDVLMDLGFTDEKQIMKALCSQLKLQPVDLSNIRIPEEITKLTEEAVLRKHNLIPFQFHEKNPNVIKVAMSDPLDIRAMDDISIITGLQIERYVATPGDIAAAIDRYYGNAEALRVAEQYTREREEQNKNKNVEAEDESNVQQAPIVKLLGQIIEQAVHKRTSDIHIEPMENQVRIRFRVDGVLHEAMRHDISLHAALIARIKIVSGLDISEKRRPQDGRATSIVDRQEYDIRVSILPTVYGEKVVMRLAKKKALTMDKKELGFPDDELAKFDKILSHPNGMILVTGPTGSGKSTTLASLIDVINKNRNEHIITLEDPIEYLHKHNHAIINQREIGIDTESYGNALRAALREDPDIILVGEMRDFDTISTAITAAETGHLVFSTLHTIGAAPTIERIIDVFPPHQQNQIRSQLASVLEAVISQQLLPTVGGKSRVAAFEVMLGTPAIKNLIREDKAHQIPSIMQTSKKLGMQTMDDSLFDLYLKHKIDGANAVEFAQDTATMQEKLF